MTKNYSPDQLEALAKIIETHKPATPTHDSYTSAPRVLKFASHSDVLGMIVRFKMESGAVKNLYFNSLVVSYLAAVITDIAEHRWSGLVKSNSLMLGRLLPNSVNRNQKQTYRRGENELHGGLIRF
jgi:hypothetical protein